MWRSYTLVTLLVPWPTISISVSFSADLHPVNHVLSAMHCGYPMLVLQLVAILCISSCQSKWPSRKVAGWCWWDWGNILCGSEMNPQTTHYTHLAENQVTSSFAKAIHLVALPKWEFPGNLGGTWKGRWQNNLNIKFDVNVLLWASAPTHSVELEVDEL